MADQDTQPLQESLSALTRYFVGDATLGQTLTRVAELTTIAVPEADLVGITMMVDGRPGTYVFTHPSIPEIDRAQYQTGEGPCIDAFQTGDTYVIASTKTEPRWPDFCKVAADHGVLSTLSLPMTVEHGTIGAMNLYSNSEHAFETSDNPTAHAFASQAAFVLANAQAYWDARTLSENLTTE